MKKSEYIQKAIDFAKKAHAGQKRSNGKSYFSHVKSVAKSVDSNVDDVVAAAYLHDVVEDSEYTLDDLKQAGFTDFTISIVDALTRRKEETYYDFICRIAYNYYASLVKLADLRDNMKDSNEGSRLDKYRFAERYLLDRME